MMVVKIGGAVGTDLSNLVEDLKGMKEVILVHGGSDEMNRLSEQLGKPPRFVTSPSGHTSRVTDEDTLDILRMTYSGSVNKRLVQMLRMMNINAIGLTGIDGGLLKGRRKEAIRIIEDGRIKVLRGDNTGTVEKVHVELLGNLLGSGYLPVITIPIEAEDGGALNADADRVAASIAAAVRADQLVLLTNKPGLLRDVDDPSSLVRSVGRDAIEGAMDIAQGRMKKKVLAAQEALNGGVSRVIISGANIERPLTQALEGGGTVIC
ncbi:MAG: [LysW]-aminoadipate kinase [Thermoplasmatota archaeon]